MDRGTKKSLSSCIISEFPQFFLYSPSVCCCFCYDHSGYRRTWGFSVSGLMFYR